MLGALYGYYKPGNVMDFEVAKSRLATALRTLDPAGSLGFEGLLRDVLVDVTKLGFGLAKSGPQDGSDVRSIGVNLFDVALEAKRYGEGTTLKVDALQAKLFESSRGPKGIDLWILAATRAISATDNEKLTVAGEELGITVLILDWPPEPEILPDLAVLCVEGAAALGRHLDGCTDLADVISSIRAHPDYRATADRLRMRLVQPDMGYSAAVAAMKEWMLGGLASDCNAASRLGGKFNNLSAPNRFRIPRPRYEARLDQWFADGQPAVLLGDEGLGKTWIFLSWWHARANSDSSLPLTLFVPAKEIGNESLNELISRLLKKRLGRGSVQFWQRRIEQWFKLRPDQPQLLLMIDGLNQHWQKRDWADLLQPAFDDQWSNRISILMSCWPDHWNDLQKLASLTPRPCEIVVERFDDAELNALLSGHGLRREDFSAAMIELMKVPRLSALAIARKGELIASGDITPERLAVEDWKHRIELRGAQLGIDDIEFQGFVAEIGKQLRSSIEGTLLTRQEIIQRLGRDSGKGREDLLPTVAELISGQWLVPTGQANQFRVNPELVPFALGLALVYELRQAGEEPAANAILAEHMDPFSGQSLGVRILRAAVTASLLDNGVSGPVRRALLIRWMSEQNFSSRDFDAFWRIIGLDVELILQIVEESWLRAGAGSIATDEVVIKGLANAHQFDSVAPLIEERVARWLGWFWKDPLQGMVLNRIDLTSSDSQQRQERLARNLAAWKSIESRSEFPSIELCKSGNVSWLSHRAFGIISFLPRARFIEAIAAWGVSRAVMGMACHFDELAWVLRLNHEDSIAARTAVWQLVDKLVESKHRLSLDAACWLLKALADPESEERLGQLPLSTEQAEKSYARFLALNDEDILNPSIEVVPEDLEDSDRLPIFLGVGAVPTSKLLLLARTNPSRLREAIGDTAMGAASLAPRELHQVLDQLSGLLTLLNDREREVLEACIDDAIAASEPEPSKDLDWWHIRRLELRISGCKGLAQLEILMGNAHDRKLIGGVNSKLLNVTQDDIRLALERFDIEADRETVLTWLMLLDEYADRRSIDGWLELPALLRHADEEIAELAIALATQSSDPLALKVVAESSWTAFGVNDRRQRFNRSVALFNASQVLKRPELLDRADREITAVWFQREPDNPDALLAYENFIRAAIEKFKSPSRTVSQSLIDHKPAIGTLLDRADEDFMLWLDQALTHDLCISSHDLMDAFPLQVLAEALMSRRPKLGLTLWTKLSEAMQGGIIKVSGLAYLPFIAPSEIADDARSGVLSEVVNDEELSDLVYQAEKHGQMTWVVGKARELARSAETEALAKSIVLLGFANESQEVESAWNDLGELVPRVGWLEDVYRRSRQNYERNLWAKYWYGRYLQASTETEAMAAHLLLRASMDRRAVNWIDKEQLAKLAPPVGRYWDLNTDSLNAASKRRREGLKNTLFWTKTMKQTQWPWL